MSYLSNLPPLRERTDDIPLLIKHFLDKFINGKSPKKVEFGKKTIPALMRYRWPGNVRELENLVERMFVLSDSPIIDIADLPDKVLTGATLEASAIPQIDLPETGIDLSTAVNEFERSIIVQALNKSNWVKNRAAKLLHVNRTTLVEKIKKQKLQKPSESNIS